MFEEMPTRIALPDDEDWKVARVGPWETFYWLSYFMRLQNRLTYFIKNLFVYSDNVLYSNDVLRYRRLTFSPSLPSPRGRGRGARTYSDGTYTNCISSSRESDVSDTATVKMLRPT